MTLHKQSPATLRLGKTGRQALGRWRRGLLLLALMPASLLAQVTNLDGVFTDYISETVSNSYNRTVNVLPGAELACTGFGFSYCDAIYINKSTSPVKVINFYGGSGPALGSFFDFFGSSEDGFEVNIYGGNGVLMGATARRYDADPDEPTMNLKVYGRGDLQVFPAICNADDTVEEAIGPALVPDLNGAFAWRSGDYVIQGTLGDGTEIDFCMEGLPNLTFYDIRDVLFNALGQAGIGGAPSQAFEVERFAVEPTILVRNAGGEGGATFRMQDDASGADFKFKATGKAGFKVRDQGNAQDVIIIDAQEDTFGRKAVYIDGAGNVGIGTGNASPLDASLVVNGEVSVNQFGILATSAESWPDYVFAEGYPLPSLAALQQFIREHGHLPGIPSRAQVQKQGFDFADMLKAQLEKIEELTLYTIELDKQAASLRARAAEAERWELELSDRLQVLEDE